MVLVGRAAGVRGLPARRARGARLASTRLTGGALARLGLLGLALLGAVSCSSSKPPHEVLAAAASLRHVLPALLAAFASRQPGAELAVSYGASGDLQRQVAAGAPIVAVLFASPGPVERLAQAGKVDPSTRRVIATNRLLLIGPRGARPITFATLHRLPPGELVAIGDPGAVPAGEYARAILSRLGNWDAVRQRAALAGDVASVLAYARRGQVAAAIVYATDIRGLTDVTVLDTALDEGALRAEVVVAATRGARSSARARAFLEFLATSAAQQILREHGFGPP